MKRERPAGPFRKLLSERGREMRRNPSTAEKKLWSHLRGDQFMGLRFRRQHRVGPYIADFYCAARKLIIELDGDSHSDRLQYDDERTSYLNAYDIHVLRFTNFEVIENIDGVLGALQRCCASRLPPLPDPLPEYGERG